MSKKYKPKYFIINSYPPLILPQKVLREAGSKKQTVDTFPKVSQKRKTKQSQPAKKPTIHVYCDKRCEKCMEQ